MTKVNHDYAEYLFNEYSENGYNEVMEMAEYLLEEFSTCSAPEMEVLEAYASKDEAVAAYAEYIVNNF